jgi:hypothetical protein
MADDERHDPDESSLELPSLRSAFRRRKRKPKAEPPPEPVEGEPAPGPVDAEPAREPVDAEPPPDDYSILPVAVTGAPPAERAAPEASIDDPQDGPLDEAAQPEAPKRRRRRRIPVHLPGPVVALITGAVVGLVLVGLTSASMHLCTAVRGTSSCGKPGILLLLLITLVVILLGALLLRLAGITAYGSTSFLGVGLLVVLVLLALLPVLDDWWVVIVVPLLAMLTYVASWWLTTTYVEPGERAR